MKNYRSMKFTDVIESHKRDGSHLSEDDVNFINNDIRSTWWLMTNNHDSNSCYYRNEYDNAEYAVDSYSSNYEAQDEVKSYNGNVPAYLMSEYPIDEHGNTLTADEIRENVAAEMDKIEDAWIAERDKFFDNVIDADRFMKHDAVYTHNYSGLMQRTIDSLGSDYESYRSSDAVYDKISKEILAKHISNPDAIDFTKSSEMPDMLVDKEIEKDGMSDYYDSENIYDDENVRDEFERRLPDIDIPDNYFEGGDYPEY